MVPRLVTLRWYFISSPVAGIPDFFISGMVTTPTASALAAAMPEMLPNRLEATTAILAAPPRKRPRGSHRRVALGECERE
jgi:hypothetical protein